MGFLESSMGGRLTQRAAITRSFTLIYTLSLLTLFTRIQLNLLGRRNYLSSVISLARPPTNASTISLEDHDDDLSQTFGNDCETNRRYLAFSWWLLHRGWRELMGHVQAAVADVFGPLNPRDDITLTRLSELTLEVRKTIEGATEDERRYVLTGTEACYSFDSDECAVSGRESGSPTYSLPRTRSSRYCKSPGLPESGSPPRHRP